MKNLQADRWILSLSRIEGIIELSPLEKRLTLDNTYFALICYPLLSSVSPTAAWVAVMATLRAGGDLWMVAGSLDLVKIPMDQLHYAVPVSE